MRRALITRSSSIDSVTFMCTSYVHTGYVSNEIDPRGVRWSPYPPSSPCNPAHGSNGENAPYDCDRTEPTPYIRGSNPLTLAHQGHPSAGLASGKACARCGRTTTNYLTSVPFASSILEGVYRDREISLLADRCLFVTWQWIALLQISLRISSIDLALYLPLPQHH